MNITLWIVAGLLAVVLLASGALKLILSKERLAASGMAAVEDFSGGTLKVVSVLEVMAAAGLVLPAAFGVAPVLVPLAAVGVVLLMVGVTGVHVRRHETQAVVAPVVLFVLAAVLAWQRFGPHAF